MNLLDKQLEEFEKRFTFDANKCLRLHNKFEVMGKDTAELRRFLRTSQTELINLVIDMVEGVIETTTYFLEKYKYKLGNKISDDNKRQDIDKTIKDLKDLLSTLNKLK